MEAKASKDEKYLINHFKICFNNDKYDNIYINKNNKILFKYLTRFKNYQYFTKIYYTDYFEKQLIYNISKYSFSKNGIHGYYSLIIPQTQIKPENVVNSVKEKYNNSDIQIDLIPNNIIDLNCNLMNETNEGFEYFIDLPTEFKNHIKTFFKLNRTEDKSQISNKIFKLTIKYPIELIIIDIIQIIRLIFKGG